MKLTAHNIGVKHLSLAQAAAVSAFTGLGLMAMFFAMRGEEAHMDHFGGILVASLATQVAEPLLARDLIHLGVLGNRIADLPEVTGAAVFTVDEQMLTLSGDVRRGIPFTQQVVHNGEIIGAVRVHIDPAGFGRTLPVGLILLSLGWVVLAPLIVLAVGSFGLPARRDPQPVTTTTTEDAQSDPEEPDRWYLITVNLFNQLSMTSERRGQELDFARHSAMKVADLYHGRVLDLPGTGFLLTFAAGSNDDRPFHVLCAAFALARLLEQEETPGRYRLGAHTLICPAGCEPVPGDDGVADAAMLSALARDNTLVVSSALLACLPYPERVEAERMHHLLLEELTSIGGGAATARRLADPHDELVTQQVAELSTAPGYAGRSTASESTF